MAGASQQWHARIDNETRPRPTATAHVCATHESKSSASCARWPGGSRTGLAEQTYQSLCRFSGCRKDDGHTKRTGQNAGAQKDDEGTAGNDALPHSL